MNHIVSIDDEWMCFAEANGKSLFQSVVNPALFKEDEDGKPYFLDAIVWVCKEFNHTHSGSAILPSGKRILSRQFVKSFPFEPKSLRIDVIQKLTSNGHLIYYIEDENQLIEVCDYYDLSPYHEESFYKELLALKRLKRRNENTRVKNLE